MKNDYVIHAEPNEKNMFSPSRITTDDRERAVAFATMLQTPSPWKTVWVEHGGKKYQLDQLGDLP